MSDCIKSCRLFVAPSFKTMIACFSKRDSSDILIARSYVCYYTFIMKVAHRLFKKSINILTGNAKDFYLGEHIDPDQYYKCYLESTKEAHEILCQHYKKHGAFGPQIINGEKDLSCFALMKQHKQLLDYLIVSIKQIRFKYDLITVVVNRRWLPDDIYAALTNKYNVEFEFENNKSSLLDSFYMLNGLFINLFRGFGRRLFMMSHESLKFKDGPTILYEYHESGYGDYNCVFSTYLNKNNMLKKSLGICVSKEKLKSRVNSKVNVIDLIKIKLNFSEIFSEFKELVSLIRAIRQLGYTVSQWVLLRDGIKKKNRLNVIARSLPSLQHYYAPGCPDGGAPALDSAFVKSALKRNSIIMHGYQTRLRAWYEYSNCYDCYDVIHYVSSSHVNDQLMNNNMHSVVSEFVYFRHKTKRTEFYIRGSNTILIFPTDMLPDDQVITGNTLKFVIKQLRIIFSTVRKALPIKKYDVIVKVKNHNDIEFLENDGLLNDFSDLSVSIEDNKNELFDSVLEKASHVITIGLTTPVFHSIWHGLPTLCWSPQSDCYCPPFNRDSKILSNDKYVLEFFLMQTEKFIHKNKKIYDDIIAFSPNEFF